MRKAKEYICIGCNKLKYLYTKNSLCRECQMLIESGRIHNYNIQKETREVVKFVVYGYDYEGINILNKCNNPEKSTKRMPYVSSFRSDVSRKLKDSLEEILESNNLGERKYMKTYESVSSSYVNTTYYVYEDVAKAIFNLFDSMVIVVEKQIEKGLEDSKSILLQLNSGALSIKDFERSLE